MDSFFQVFSDNIMQFVSLVFTSVVTYIGLQIKKVYENYMNDKMKKEIVSACVIYVEQRKDSLNLKTSDEKFLAAEKKSREWLDQKKIKISDAELEILIENAVNAYNKKNGI